MDNNNFLNEYKILGRNIAYYRSLKELSQLQLAEKIGISRTHMGNIETYDAAASLDVIFAIASALEIPPSKLFESR